MFDCHTHVNLAAFKQDWQEVIDRALAASIALVNVGTQKDTSLRAVELAHQYPDKPVYAAIGLHPVHTSRSYHDEAELGPVDAFTVAEAMANKKAVAGEGGWEPKGFTSRGEEFDRAYYRKLAEDPKVVAIGECGFDYYRPTGDPVEYKKRQRAAFFEQVLIAQQTDKALMIHCRPSKNSDDAYEDLLLAIQEWQFSAERAILHFYVGSPAMTKKFLDAGFNFEFGGVITFARDYDEQLSLIPLDRLLTETDAPYVAPLPYRGQRNEPLYIAEVVKKIAAIKNTTSEEVATTTTQNAKRIFKL